MHFTPSPPLVAPRSYSQVLVDLAGLTVLSQQSSQHTLSPHPLHFGGHSCLLGTLPLTGTSVTAGTLGGVQVTSAGSGLADDGLPDDLSVLDQLADVGTGVGVADVILLSGVAPDLPLADTEDGGGQSLLTSKVDHVSVVQRWRPMSACDRER